MSLMRIRIIGLRRFGLVRELGRRDEGGGWGLEDLSEGRKVGVLSASRAMGYSHACG